MDLIINNATHALICETSGVEWYGGSLDALFDLLVAVLAPQIRLRIVNAAAARATIGHRLVTVIMDAIAKRGPDAITLPRDS